MWGALDETRFDLRGRLFDIPFRINPWFWVITAGLGVRAGGSVQGLLVWIGCVLVSILIHEYGHALTARAFGARDPHIVLYSMGGLAFSGGVPKRWQRVTELFMGPGAGFLFLSVVCLAIWLLPSEPMSKLMKGALHDLYIINLYWGLFNLLPLYPLDGGQIVSELCQARKGVAGHALALKFSIGVIILLVGGALLLFLLPSIRTQLPSWLHYDPGLTLVLFLVFLLFDNLLQLKIFSSGMQRGGFGAEDGQREPWEQPDDWWKR